MILSLQAVSGRSDFEVIQWVNRASDETLSKDELGYAPYECTTLDQKLAFSLMGILSGDLLNHLAQMNQEYLISHNRPLPALRVM